MGRIHGHDGHIENLRAMNSSRCLAAVVVVSSLTVLGGFLVIGPSAFAGSHQECRKVGQIVICRVVSDPPPGKGGGGGKGGGSGKCTKDGTTIPCYIPGDGTWDAAHSCYATAMDPPPPLGDPLWQGHTTGAVIAAPAAKVRASSGRRRWRRAAAGGGARSACRDDAATPTLQRRRTRARAVGDDLRRYPDVAVVPLWPVAFVDVAAGSGGWSIGDGDRDAGVGVVVDG